MPKVYSINLSGNAEVVESWCCFPDQHILLAVRALAPRRFKKIANSSLLAIAILKSTTGNEPNHFSSHSWTWNPQWIYHFLITSTSGRVICRLLFPILCFFYNFLFAHNTFYSPLHLDAFTDSIVVLSFKAEYIGSNGTFSPAHHLYFYLLCLRFFARKKKTKRKRRI